MTINALNWQSRFPIAWFLAIEQKSNRKMQNSQTNEYKPLVVHVVHRPFMTVLSSHVEHTGDMYQRTTWTTRSKLAVAKNSKLAVAIDTQSVCRYN